MLTQVAAGHAAASNAAFAAAMLRLQCSNAAAKVQQIPGPAAKGAGIVYRRRASS
jgi:hypothetical protein